MLKAEPESVMLTIADLKDVASRKLEPMIRGA